MGGTSETKENSPAVYIGVSGPETPKFLLANNFLSEFFITKKEEQTKQYSYDYFYQAGVFQCEEGDEQKKKQLAESFDTFFQRFAGEDLIKSNYEGKHFYFPIKPWMLRGAGYRLRHLLYHMIPGIEQEKKYRRLQEQLFQYLYGRNEGVSYLLSAMCEKAFQREYKKKAGKKSEEFEMLKKSHYKKVCNNFEADLNKLLTHEFFLNLDFYKRYDYLATLLNRYVIQFIVNKVSGANRGKMLCQGSATSHLLDGGAYHRACVQNYADIRAVFQKELKKFYIQRLETEVGKDGKIKLLTRQEDIQVISKGHEELFDKFVLRIFNSKYSKKDSLYQSVRKAFGIPKEGQMGEYTVDEFVMYYIDVSKAGGGNVLTKISSTLPTCGKDIDFIFPKSSSKHKFFAMSPSLLEFYVRMYLAKEDRTYAYLDNFLLYLQERYGICIQKTEQMDQILKKMHIKVPFQEFRQNEQALLDNLDEINCLIRLSDSGYVVTLPEEKGEFTLL